METAHKKELDDQDELICLLKENLKRVQMVINVQAKVVEEGSRGLTEELYGTKDSFLGVLHLPC